MLGLTPGEFGLVVFIALAIVTARYFPRVGERVALRLRAGRGAQKRGNAASS